MSESLAETIDYNGYRIEIHYDHDSQHADPRDADNLGVLFAPHRSYTLGDANHPSDEYDQASRAFEHFTEYGNRGGIRAFERWLKVYLGASVVLPLGLIDHSGISMYVGGGAHAMDPGGWDSGTIGVIFDTTSTREATGAPIEDIERQLIAEVEEYDLYLTGQVYGFVIYDPDGDDTNESCWGFLGEKYVIEEAKSVVDAEIKYRKEHPKTASPGISLLHFTVADLNIVLGRELLHSEIDLARKHFEMAGLNEAFAEAAEALPKEPRDG